jgi:hypothetical protein
MTLSPPGDTPHLTLSPARAMSRSRTSHIALKRRAQAPVLSVGRAGVTPGNLFVECGTNGPIFSPAPSESTSHDREQAMDRSLSGGRR